MKKILTLLFLTGLIGLLHGQAVFSVDMNGYNGPSFNSVYMSGTYNDWNGESHPLNDDDGDGIWTITHDFSNGDYEYKFTIDNWTVFEIFDPNSNCTLTTGEFTNRLTTVSNGTANVCFKWNTCNECDDAGDGGDGGDNGNPTTPITPPAPPEDLYNVTFQVDMNGYTTDFFNFVAVSGSFNAWSGGRDRLSDDDGDGIWTGTIAIPEGTHEYLFTIDTWTDQERFEPGSDCTLTTGEFTNRVFNITQDASVCFTWNTCISCGSSGIEAPLEDVDVTFAVDMNGYNSSFGQVYVSGTLNNWAGDANPLSDDDGDGIWTTTIPLAPAIYEYKFTLDNWDVQEMLESGSECTLTTDEFTNRVIDATSVVSVCYSWESCAACGEGGDSGTDGGDGGTDGGDSGTDGGDGGTDGGTDGGDSGTDGGDGGTDGGDSGTDGGNGGDDGQPMVDDVHVTFAVDMNGYDGEFGQVYVSGTLNNWAGDANPLSDEDGDGIWSTTIPLAPRLYEYKFTLDNWTVQESLEPGSECTLTTNEFTNRLISPTTDLSVCYKWNSCTACGEDSGTDGGDSGDNGNNGGDGGNDGGNNGGDSGNDGGNNGGDSGNDGGNNGGMSSSTIFADYPWLSTIVDPNNCDGTTVQVYNSSGFVYLNVVTATSTILYSATGTQYCISSEGYNCLDFYTVDSVIENFTCGAGGQNGGGNNGNDGGVGGNDGGNNGNDGGDAGMSTSTIFADYPWLSTIVDPNNCDGTTVQVYNSSGFVYLNVVTATSTILYSANGTQYCVSSEGYNCLDFYTVDSVIENFTCGASGQNGGGNGGNGGGNSGNNGGDAGMSTSTIFADYPWLSTIVDPNNCDGTTVQVYNSGGFVYLNVKTATSTILYSANGTLYCTSSEGYNCLDFYTVDSVIENFTCGAGGQNDGGNSGNNGGTGGMSTSAIFADYPWLSTIVDPNNCDGTSIQVYNSAGYVYLNVVTATSTVLYNASGAVYCTSGPGFNCLDFYPVNEVIENFSCTNGQLNTEEIAIDFKVNSTSTIKSTDFRVYPNPSNGLFFLELANTSDVDRTITILNTQGQTIQQLFLTATTTEQNLEFNLGNKAAGMYFIQVSSKEENSVKRLIVK